MQSRLAVIFGALAIAVAPHALMAQQPIRGWEPRGFEFSRNGAWRARARRVRAARAAALARGDVVSLNAPLRQAMALRAAPGAAARPSAMAVGGVLHEPVFIVAFKNTDTTVGLWPASLYQSVLFDAVPPLGRPFTVHTFYDQMSHGLLDVEGQVYGWIPLDSNDAYYEGPMGSVPCNGLCGASKVSHILAEAVQKVDATVDFGQYDNDGPDGIPNSGDDDGFVDVAVLVQPEVGAECKALVPSSADNLWSHRFSYAGWTGNYIRTNDHRNHVPSGPTDPDTVTVIRVNDYTLQSGVGGSTACDGSQIMPPGTIAHETGHIFDLPDLYDVTFQTEGIGEWGLMGSGNYARPLSPAHMEGWSRLQLGWVTLVDITANATDTLSPYTVGDTIMRIRPAPGVPNPRGESFLIENRQATDGDTALIGKGKGPGLLIYHLDQLQYDQAIGSNSVNAGGIHALRILQADGLGELDGQLCQHTNCRGDAGDPFPGESLRTTIGYATNPSNALNGSGASPGFTIDAITQLSPNGPMSFRVVFPPAILAMDTALSPGVMGAPYGDTLRVSGGNGTFLFAPASAVPPGLALSTSGVFSGYPANTGTFLFTVNVTSGPSSLSLPLHLVVSAPQLQAQAVADQLLLGGTHLTADEQRYIDLSGNGNNAFDLGDVTAWVDRNPHLITPVLRRLIAGLR